MIQTRGSLSSALPLPAGSRSNSVVSDPHYEALARRIVAGLRIDSRPFVLAVGDPPANPLLLSEALGNAAGPGYAVIVISCGPELRRADLERAVSTFSDAKDASDTAAENESSAPASALLVFDNVDRLSNKQIEDIHQEMLGSNRMQRAAVLLAPLDFVGRLERPALQFLKERIAARYRFQELGEDEAIAALHHQLLSQRDSRIEARGLRRGIMIGLAAGLAVSAAGIGAFLISHSSLQPISAVPASIGASSAVTAAAPVLRPEAEAAQSALSAPALPDVGTAPTRLSAPTPETETGNSPTIVAVAPAEQSSLGPRLSAAEIAALVARGDAVLGTGDITSARLFYERAAEAESGLAALHLGASFDPGFQTRGAARAAADPARALFWYRRARELGVEEAGQRIPRLDTQPASEPHSRSH